MMELSNVICLFIAVSIVAFIYYFFVKDKLLNTEASNTEESNAEESNEKEVTFSDEVEEINKDEPPPLPERKNKVIETGTGLRIEHLKKGKGKSPKITDKVLVHYEGQLESGTIFDSSIKRGEPIDFQLQEVIAGWTEGLQLMKPGGKARLFIPPHLGYGPEGSGPIPGGATLIFHVELLKVL